MKVKKAKKLRPSDYVIKSILYLYALLVIFPIIWIVYTSFKTNMEFVANPWALGQGLAFENYVNAWVRVNFGTYMLNSFIITLAAVAITTVLASSTSYILVRMKRLRLNNIIIFIFLSGMYVPTALILPSMFLLLNRMGLYDNRGTLVMLFVVFSLPYSILILTGFFRAMPREIEEAALVDGCGHNRTFWQIVFPLARGGVATTIIFNLIWIWNDYIFALTFIADPAKRTLPVGIIGLMATFRLRADWVTLFAGLNMVMIPTIVLYIIFQKKLTGGLIAGAVKG